MRILSNFRDYYDGVQGHGFDDRIIYVRKTVEDALGARAAWAKANSARPPESDDCGLAALTEHRPQIELIDDSGYNDGIDDGLLCLAGRGYPFWTRVRSDGRPPLHSFQDGFAAEVEQGPKHHWGHRREASLQPWRDWVAENWGREIDPSVHFRLNTPVALWRNGIWTANPNLREMDFQKVLDPYTVFQEIETFLAGVMSENRDPPSPMTDREKISSHGMDVKRSFRKMPRD